MEHTPTTRAIAGGKVKVLCGTKLVVDEGAALDPAKGWTRSIPGVAAGACKFELLEASGKTLLEYTEGEVRATGAEAVKLGAQNSTTPTGGRRAESGAAWELQGDLHKASEAYGDVPAGA